MKETDLLHFLLQDQIYVIDGFEVPEEEAESPELATFEFYGENKNKVLLLVAQETTDLLKSKEYDLMLKIMAAVKHTPNEFALVNIATQEVDWMKVSTQLQPQTVIAFGIDAQFLPFQAALYQIGTENELKFLMAEGLSTYVNDRTGEQKKQLWGALKQLFSV